MRPSFSSRAAIAITILVLAGCTTLPASASARGQFDRTLHVTGSVNLQVETGSGSIDVTTGSSNEVKVIGRIYASEWFGGNAEERVKRLESNPPIQQSGNDIRIGHIDDPELKHNISISYELVVPANTQLHSSSGSGSESISGIAGPLEAGTGSGIPALEALRSMARRAVFTLAPGADPSMPRTWPEVSTARPAAAISRSIRALPVRSGQKPGPEAWNFAICMGRCKLKLVAEISRPRAKPLVNGTCTRGREA